MYVMYIIHVHMCMVHLPTDMCLDVPNMEYRITGMKDE